MKTKVFSWALFVVALIAISSPAIAQTRQKELVANFGEMYIPCVERWISGTWVAHFTYFLGKDGKISRMHVNTWSSDFHDVNSGEEVKCFDVINDTYGAYFWFLNNPNAANNGTDIYNVEDGWLDEFMPEVYPFAEGTMVEMNWKFQIRGQKWGMSSLIQIHTNANGEPTANVVRTKVICKE